MHQRCAVLEARSKSDLNFELRTLITDKDGGVNFQESADRRPLHQYHVNELESCNSYFYSIVFLLYKSVIKSPGQSKSLDVMGRRHEVCACTVACMHEASALRASFTSAV